MVEELEKIKAEVGADAFAEGNYRLAGRLFDEIIAAEELAGFLTLKAYDYLD
jgi:malate synthase